MNQFLLQLPLACFMIVLSVVQVAAEPQAGAAESPVAFAQSGKLKMLYDCRQRPQSVLLHDRLFIVYNGDATPTKNGEGSAYPMLISYDVHDRSWSRPVRLDNKSHSDHHFTPIIWADEADYLHVLFGCHKTPGTLAARGDSVNLPFTGIK